MQQFLEIWEFLEPWVPLILTAFPFVVWFVSLLVHNKLNLFARETVAAVYRAAILTASSLHDNNLQWLRGPSGIAYRKNLARRAYDMIPSRVGIVPIGILKVFVTRDQFADMVEHAFREITTIATDITDRECSPAE